MPEPAAFPGPVDERRHLAPPDPAWLESWSLDFLHGNADLAGSFELVLAPAANVAAFHAAVVGRERNLVSLAETAAAIPAAPGLELRAPGLWAEIGIQTPFEHVTVDIEAFAVELDDPDDVFGRAYGRRVALGSDLEWERAADVTDLSHGGGLDGYAVPNRVHGELLVGTDAYEIDGWGWRSHRWGLSIDNSSGIVRGRGPGEAWWHEPFADGTEGVLVARAPIAHRIGPHVAALEQRLVAGADGDRLGWARWPLDS